MRAQQLDLFATEPPVTAAVLKEERFFGRMDALCGLPLRGPESCASRISGARLAAEILSRPPLCELRAPLL